MKKLYALLSLLLLVYISGAQQAYDITFDHDGKTVYGTFTTPNGVSKFPTIIINPGSGAIDRDGTLPLTDANSACLYPALYGDTLKIYKELSDALVDSGYAVLRYDKLEYTYPTTLDTITFDKLWLPVESAIDYVKTRSDVDTNSIILIGHSEGSSLIPFIAKGRKDVKALISIAGARTPFDSLYAWQLNNLVALLRPCGATVNDSISAASQAKQILNYFNVIRTDTWNSNTPAAFGAPASAWYDYIRATDSVAINYNLDSLPTLFTGMGLDIQVPPSELLRLQNDVTITNDFWSIPGLIHEMVPDNNPHVSPVLTDTIIYWLRQLDRTTGLNDNYAEGNFIETFPNPFNSTVTLSIAKQGIKTLSVSAYNILGQTILKFNQTNISSPYTKTIQLGNQASGIYFLEVNVDGKRTVKKIVRE